MSFLGITKLLDARDICATLSDVFKKWFVYRLGKGNLSFWFCPWADGKSMVDKYPSLNVPKHAKVLDLWRERMWRLLDPTDETIDAAWEDIK